MEHKRNTSNPPANFGYSLGHAITEGAFTGIDTRRCTYMMNKYPVMADIWPFNQPVFLCQEFDDTRRNVYQMVTLSAHPLPLRTMVQGLWAWALEISLDIAAKP